MNTIKKSNFGFLKVAAASPKLRVADIDYNTGEIIKQLKKAASGGARLVVFPELSITGYTAADLFHQRAFLEAVAPALVKIAAASRNLNSVAIVGAPVPSDGKIYNAAIVIFGGKILGIIPKTYIPGYKEFYEERWFASARDLVNKEVEIGGKKVPIGADLLFKFPKIPGFVLGIEICEDLWTPLPPSAFQSIGGATIIANLSASNDLVGKADYRRSLVAQQSARLISGYIYSSCGVYESTTDVVFGGHLLIAENGGVLNESQRFSRNSEIIFSEIDLEHLAIDRERTTSFGESVHEGGKKEFRFIDVPMSLLPLSLIRQIDPHPFVPQNPNELDKRSEEIFNIQSAGLAKRLEYAKLKKMIIGVSGGLDSTLALLVSARTADLLELPRQNILAFTMPGFATTKRTKSNALKLAELLGAETETIDITAGAKQHLKELGHDGKKQDLVFQNVQARYRTLVLMNKSNQLGGIVVGTGDLSELALGWNTFTGDQISHYNVNAGVPKTLVRYLVDWVSKRSEFQKAKKVLKDILDTPISPELVKEKGDKITQKTEDLIGPYELHDFFLYHFLRWGSGPRKILFLAERAFGKKYSAATIKKWLKSFLERFFGNQWKRSVMPDGPKVGSVALSPRGDWRMPSDAEAKLWLKEL